MKSKVLSFTAIVLAIIFVCILTGCNSSKFPDVKLEINSENLMQNATVVGDNLSNKEISGRNNILKKGNSYWTAINDGKSNSVQFKLKESCTFNTAIISEIGDSVMYFRLEAFIGGSWKLIYASEKMQDRRIISFDSVTTDSLRLTIDKFKRKNCKIKGFELYNITEGKDNFNTTVYQRLDGDVPTEILKRSEEDIKTFARFYDVYNTIIVFDVVKWSEKGEMSFVGPRPWITDYKKYFTKNQIRRLEVLPGITGLAQASGRNNLTVKEKIELDIYYVDHLSLRMDIKVIIGTVKSVLSKQGAELSKSGIKNELEELKEQYTEEKATA